MDDASGESCLYDKVALRFKGGTGWNVLRLPDLPDNLAERILNNSVLQKRLVVSIPSRCDVEHASHPHGLPRRGEQSRHHKYLLSLGFTQTFPPP